ncbi:MAG: DMT family transporter [Patescibacteria group bacterium]
MNKYKLAIALALLTAVFSGVNNFITKIAVTAVKDPVVFTTLKNAIVAVFLIGIIIVWKKRSELAKLTPRQKKLLILIGIIGGSIPFILYFTGLKQTSALNASLIHKTLFVWVAIMAVPILKEKIGWLQFAAMGLLFGGTIAVGGFQGFKLNGGELMILGATLFWAVENIIAKFVLRDVSSILLAGARMILGSIILFAVVLFQNKAQMMTGLSLIQWSWTLLTSVLLLGYVISWYTALKYAPVTVVASLLVPATLITNILTAIFVTHTMPNMQIWSNILLGIGTILLIYATVRRWEVKHHQQTQSTSL